ncbi:MAG: phenylalanine--tRNA ligase subunit beta, partial [Hyphomicrobiaceae bacterium]
ELSDDHEGVIDLPAELADRLGERFVDVAGLNDPTIEIGITPNRPDALGVRGVARDLAAAGLGRLKKENKGYKKRADYDCPVPIELRFPKGAGDACPVFAGRYIRALKNGPSPKWLQDRLRAIGLRPINALVDVTNFITYDRARPLHVYDADNLRGAIHARLGNKGEKFLALDGKEYEADGDMTVIADESGALGFGGIIGGGSTGCTQGTVNVLIESAYFDPVRTAMTGRRTGIHSDARYRFERGIDPQSEELGIDLATALILDICGGDPSRTLIAGKMPDPKHVVHFDTDEVERLTGVKLKDSEIKKVLKQLGFEIDGKGEKIKVDVPSWRPDVHGSADLVEEVIRIVGIDTVPAVAMPRHSGVAKPVMTEHQLRVRRARRLLAGRGLTETINWSFIRRAEAKLFGGGDAALELANPISSEMSDMRPSLLPGLLTAAQRNLDRSIASPAIFEIGQIYKGDRPEDQFTAVAGVRLGTAKLSGAGRHWSGTAGPVDVYDAKADFMAVLQTSGLDTSKLQLTRDAPAWFHPGRSAVARLGPKIIIGAYGELHPAALADLDVEGPAVAFELLLEEVPKSKRKSRARPPLEASDLQPVRRDFAFLLDSTVAAGEVIRAAQSADKKLITDVTVFDVFEGKSLGQGKKSLAIEVTLQPKGETLTDDAIDAVAKKIVAQVTKATGGAIRG